MNAMQMGENWGGENVEAQADEAAAAEEDDSDAPEEAEDLPIVSAPVKKPKLKINTKYAKPAQNVETESNSGEAGERQRGAAEES
jgi:hypothetical protein